MTRIGQCQWCFRVDEWINKNRNDRKAFWNYETSACVFVMLLSCLSSSSASFFISFCLQVIQRCHLMPLNLFRVQTILLIWNVVTVIYWIRHMFMARSSSLSIVVAYVRQYLCQQKHRPHTHHTHIFVFVQFSFAPVAFWAYVPCIGVKTFKYKQSSDWFCKNGNKRFRYSNRPFGIFSNAPVSFWIFGNRCGHTGLNLSDMRTPSHGDGARVGLNLQKRKRRRKKNEKILLVEAFVNGYVLCVDNPMQSNENGIKKWLWWWW